MSKKVKNILRPICIVLVLLSIILLGKFAWSRYMKSLNGTAKADIAKFIVKVNGQTDEEFELNFAETMNSNASVSSGYVAPGTSGAFTLEVDATESDVSVEYYLSMDVSKKPTNLLLYSDSAHTTLVDLPVSNKIISIDSILVSDSTKTKSTTIYWDWQYETGETDKQIDANDVIDSKYMGKEVIMPVQVKAVQKSGSGPNTYFNKSFADMVHVGDIVNYDPTSGLSQEQITTIGTYKAEGTITTQQKAEQSGTGQSVDQTFVVNDPNDKITTWKVLGINENGAIKLMGITPQKLTIGRQAGYNNGEEIMNKIAEIYGHGAGATGATSIKIEDIEEYTCFDKTKYSLDGYTYGDRKTYIFDNKGGSFVKLREGVKFIIEDINGNAIEDTNGNSQLTIGSEVNVQRTHYFFQIQDFKKAGISDNVYTMLTQGDYWLASRFCILYDLNCFLGYRYAGTVNVGGNGLLGSDGGWGDSTHSVGVVVTLQSDIEATETSENSRIWELNL